VAGTLRDNRNEIIKVVRDFWVAAPTLVGLPGPYAKIVVADADNDSNPDDVNPGAGGNKLPFCRVRVQHAEGVPTSVSGRRWRNSGTVTVNLFVPRTRTDAWMRCGELGDKLTDAFRKSRGNVSYRSVTPRERPNNNGFNQVDVVADFYWTSFNLIGA
jgi:hypothetical protein